jgi:putative transcriptional regulator
MAKKKPLGQELIGALDDVLEFEQSGVGLRTTTVVRAEPPRHWTKEQIARLRRDKLQISQPVFAALFTVSEQTIRAWEQGSREPSGIARRFMEIADRDPKIVLQLLKPAKIA